MKQSWKPSFRNKTSCKCHRTTRPHCAYVALMIAGTSSQARKLHVNRTCVQQSSWHPGGMVFITEPDSANETMMINRKSHDVKQDAWTSASLKDYDGMVFITWTHRTKKTALNTGTMSGFVTEKTRGSLPQCQSSFVNENLSDHGGTVFITKTIQYEYSKDHHWDLLQNNNTQQMPQWTSLMDMSSSNVMVASMYQETTQWNTCNKKSLGPLHEKGSIKSAIYNYHGGIIIKKPHRTNVAMPVKNTLEKSCQTKFLKQRPSKIMVV